MRFLPGRLLAAILTSFLLLAVFVLPDHWRSWLTAKASNGKQQLVALREARQERHEQLRAAFESNDAQSIRQAFATLTKLDEPGALKLWQAALKVEDPQQKQQVWNEYQK